MRFNYTGGVQTYTITEAGYYKLEVFGSRGANGSASSGGKGGYASGIKYLDAGTTLYIVCGGQNYNGGGSRGTWSSQTGGVGGGATHIATVTGTLSSIGLPNLDKVLIVAGGGGGGSGEQGSVTGGVGGGLTGGSTGKGATGGTQTQGGSNGGRSSNGSFGQGGNNNTSDVSGGGGGGLYGGGGGTHAGGGGSSYIDNVLSGCTESGINDTTGYAIINRIQINPPEAGTISITSDGTDLSLLATANGGYDFDYWELDGYTRLDYIESSGTQYFNLSTLNPNALGRVECAFTFASSVSTYAACLLGSSSSSNSARIIRRYNGANSGWNFQVSGVSASGTSATNVLTAETRYEFDVDFNNGYGKVNNTIIYNFTGYPSSSYSFRNLYLLADNDSDGVSWRARGKLEYFKAYDRSGNIIMNLIPAIRKNDSVVGMYDDVNGVFYTNAGSGTFIAGGLVDAPLNIIYTDNPLSFKLGSDVELVANFELMYNITINYDVTLGSATYQLLEGTQVEFTATPYANAQFLGWYLEDELVSTNRTIELTIEDDFTIEARFEDIYEITTNCIGNGNITYTRGGTDKNLVTFTATPYLISRFIRFIYNYTAIVDKGALTSDEDKIITQDNNYLMISTQEGRSTEYEESSFTVRLYSDVTLIAYFEDVFECIYDRVQPDVDRVKELNEKLQKDNYTQDELAEWRTEMKGSLNLSDLTRVRNNTKYLALRLGVSITAQDNIPEIPTEEFYSIMLNNVKAVKEAWMVYADTPALPANPLNYYPKWNIIEKTLWDIYSILEASMWYHAGIDLMAEDNILI